MQALRFADPDKRPPDSRQTVMTDAVHWLVELHPFGWPGSVARFGWLGFLGYAPRWLVERQVRKARTQTNRSLFWRSALSLTRKFE